MLDTVLPTYEVREYHRVLVEATAEAAVAAALALPAATDPIVAALFWLRGIPGGALPLRAFLARLGLDRVVSADRAFVGMGDLLGVRIAFAIPAETAGDQRARLATETRVHGMDRAARRRFRLYWLVVGPFSALIRRHWLSAASRAAESGG